MSKENSPEPASPQNKTGLGVKFALSAGVLGLALGAGLYALLGGHDNTVVANDAIEQECAVDQSLKTKLDSVAVGHVAAFKPLDRAYSIADIQFKNEDGATKTLADWKGKTVLLNLWATWCAPCRVEMPALDKLQGELGGDQFEVVPISVDLGDDVKPRKFFEDTNIQNMKFYHDGSLDSLNSLKKNGLAFGLPATILANSKGCVLGVLNGPAEWSSKDAQSLVKAAW